MNDTEARQLNLPGSDTYRRIQLAYKNERDRDHLAISLNIEALKIFNLSIKISQHQSLIRESERVQTLLESGTFFEEYQRPSLVSHLMEFMNLEYFYIATGFELHFKSWLLQNNFIINIIADNELFKGMKNKQKRQPITKNEFFEVGNFQYDPQRGINILQGITDQSLSFNTISKKPDYINALNISTDLLGIVEDYRNLRNQIHLPGELAETPTLRRLGQQSTEIIIDFIKERIVNNSNEMIQMNSFRFQALQKI